MQIRKLVYAGGAEITGLDLSKELPASVIAEIRAAWLEYVILVFPGQNFTPEQHIRFSRYFGELEEHPVKNFQGSEYPEIFEVTNRMINGKPSETGEIGRKWHSDGAYTVRPPTGSFLHCRALPEAGGNTWFANMYMAYDRLSEKMKSIVDQLEVMNDLGDLYRRVGPGMRDPGKVADDLKATPPVIQPMVRVHAETGRRALYLNEAVTYGIVGMTREESQPLLEFLFRHSVRPEFTYRHYWRLHDLVFWDNRCAMHLAPKDYDAGQIRQMCRTTLTGAPHGRYLEAA